MTTFLKSSSLVLFSILISLTSCTLKERDHYSDTKNWGVQNYPEMGIQVELSTVWKRKLDYILTLTPSKNKVASKKFESCEVLYLNFYDKEGMNVLHTGIPLAKFALVRRDKSEVLTGNYSIECSKEKYNHLLRWSIEFPCYKCNPKEKGI